MNNKKLSIIIPMYNAEKYIEQCLMSIINNKSQNYEIIVIDDGSTDDSANICKKIMKGYDNIFYFYKKNEGVSSARNYGISMAKGEYIMFVDADDYVSKNWIEIIDKIDYSYDIIYFSKRLIKTKSKAKMLKLIIGYNKERISFSGPCSRIYKTKLILNNKILYKEDLINGEDEIFNIESLIYAEKINIINESFYNYRLVENTATKQFNKKIIENDRKFQKYLKEILYKNDVEDKNDILNFCKSLGILTIVQRLSFIKDYRDVKKYLNFLNDITYKDFRINIKYISFKNKMLLFFIKLRIFYLVYLLYKLKNKRNRNKTKFKLI